MGDPIASLMGLAATRDPVAEVRAQRAFEAAFDSTGASGGSEVDGCPMPERLGRYELLDRIGRGSFGVVYRARDPELSRDVAIKIVPGVAAGPASCREARAAARLRHPNVVTVHDVGIARASTCASLAPFSRGPGVYIVMELLEGQDFRRWLQTADRTPEEVVGTLHAAAKGLCAAHAAGLVHRDFKPSNVVVGNGGRVTVVDFGLAVGLTADDARPPNEERFSVAGSPRYMAPEQHIGGPVDARSDQYAFCVTLYEALVGKPPFTGESLPELLAAKRGPLPSAPGLSRRVHAALARGLSFYPEDRFDSMGALLARVRGQRSVRRFVQVGLVLGSGAVATTLAMPPAQAPAAADPCLDARTSLTGLWDDNTRRDVRRTFSQSSLPGASSASKLLTAHLDRFAEDWSDSVSQTCVVRASARERCLLEQRDEVALLTQLILEGDPTVMQHAWVAAESIPDPERCAGIDVATYSGPLQRQDDRGRVLAHARVLARTGRTADAQASLEPLLHAEDSDVSAGAWALQCELVRGDAAAATRACQQAANAYEEQGRDAAAVAHLAVAARHASRGQLPKLARTLYDVASAKAVRIGNPPAAQRQLALAYARMTDDPAELLARADAAYSTLGPEDLLERLRLMSESADALNALGRHRERIGRLEYALTLAESSLGEAHPAVAKLLNNLGVADRAIGEHARAVSRFEQALELKEAIGGPDATHNATTLVNLARGYLLLGDPARAGDPLRRARQLSPPDSWMRETTELLSLAVRWRLDPRAQLCSNLEQRAEATPSSSAAPIWIESALCWQALRAPTAASQALHRVDKSVTATRVRGRWWLAQSVLAMAQGDARAADVAEARGRTLLHDIGCREDSFDALDRPGLTRGVLQ